MVGGASGYTAGVDTEVVPQHNMLINLRQRMQCGTMTPRHKNANNLWFQHFEGQTFCSPLYLEFRRKNSRTVSILSIFPI
jgi:hypothetical protein